MAAAGEVLINILTKGDPKGANRVTASLEQLEKRAIAVGKSLTLKLTAPITASFGVSVAAYGKQERAEIELAAALRATGQEVENNLRLLKEQASAIQQVTTVGDELSLELAATATQMGIQADQIDETIRGAIGLSKAFKIDVRTAVRGAAAAIQGKTELLTRYIPMLSELETEGEKVAAVQKAMQTGFSQAEAEAQSTLGSIEQLKNSFGDLTEEIGEQLVPILKPAMESLRGMITEFSDLDDGTKRVLVTLGLLTASAGPLALIVGMGAKTIRTLNSMRMAMIGLSKSGNLAMASLGRAGLIGTMAALSFSVGTAIDQMTGFSDMVADHLVPPLSKVTEEGDRVGKRIRGLVRDLKEGDDAAGIYQQIANAVGDLREKLEGASGEEARALELQIQQLENARRRAELITNGTIARREAAKAAAEAAEAAEREAKAQASINGVLLQRTEEQRKALLSENERLKILRLRARGLNAEADAIEEAAAWGAKVRDYAAEHGLTIEESNRRLEERAALEATIARQKEKQAAAENTRDTGGDIVRRMNREARIFKLRAAGREEEAAQAQYQLDLEDEINAAMERGALNLEMATDYAKSKLAAAQAEAAAHNSTTEALKDQQTQLQKNKSEVEKLAAAAEAAGKDVRFGGENDRDLIVDGRTLGNKETGLNMFGESESDKLFAPAGPADADSVGGVADPAASGRQGRQKGEGDSEAGQAIREKAAEISESVQEMSEETLAALQAIMDAFSAFAQANKQKHTDLANQIANTRN